MKRKHASKAPAHSMKDSRRGVNHFVTYETMARPLFPCLTSQSGARMSVMTFLQTGTAFHSGRAMLLGATLRYCEMRGIAYRLSARPGKGYYLELVDPETGEPLKKEAREDEG